MWGHESVCGGSHGVGVDKAEGHDKAELCD